MAGQDHDFHEHFEAGFRPHAVLERYYFQARPDSLSIAWWISARRSKRRSKRSASASRRGAANRGSLLRAQLAGEGKRLPLLGDSDATANREYVRQFLLDENREYGKPYKVGYAERFWYIDERRHGKSKVDEYVEKNAVRI